MAMDQEQGATQGVVTDVLISLLLAAANLLLLLLVGHWLVISGAIGLAICALVVIQAVRGQARGRRLCSDVLLAVTLLNFNSWAFSHLSNLLVFLGLFFFVLFGLIMGAAVYRLLLRWQHAGRAAHLAVGLCFVFGAWWGGLVLEASYVPEDAVRFCNKHYRRLAPGVTVEQQRETISNSARAFLREQYGSSGVLGYLRWGLADGEVSLTAPGREKPATYPLRQRGWWLSVRLALSFLLLAFGVFSQLKAPRQRHAEADDTSSSDELELPAVAEPKV